MSEASGGASSATERAARLCLYAALASPLFYMPTLVFGWTLPGALWGRVAVAGAGLCVAVMAVRGSVRLRLPIHDPMVWILAASLGVSLAGAGLGVSPRHSLFGNLERQGGMVAGAYLVLWYLFARGLLEEESWRGAVRLITVVAAAAAVVAVGQWIQLAAQGAEELRAHAPLGNPGQLGIFMVLGVSGAAVSASDPEAGGTWRRWAVAAGTACLVGLLASGTRAALLGLAAGAAAGGGIWAVRSGSARLAKLGAVMGGVLVVGLGLLGVRATQGEEGLPDPSEIVGGLADLQHDPTLQRRLIAWEAAGDAAAERPLAGWGPENFRIAFDRFGDPGRPYVLDRSISYDRAHNVFAEAAVAAGLPGLLAAVSLAGTLVLLLWKVARQGGADTSLQAGAVAGGIVAYGVFLLFWYQDTSVSLAFLVLVGLAAQRVEGDRWPEESGPEESGGPEEGWAARAALVALGVLATGVALHAVQLIRPARALHEARTTTDASRKFAAFDRAVEERVPGAEEAVTGYAAALAGLAPRVRRMARRPGARRVLGPAFRSAGSALGDQIEVDPMNARLRALRGRLLLAEARFRGDRAVAERAAGAMARAVELAPAQLFYRYTLAEILRILGEHDRSVAVLRQALEAAPEIDETRLHLARAFVASARPADAAEQIVAGQDAVGVASDTVLLRRLLAELPREDPRLPDLQEILARTRTEMQSRTGDGR